jgi:hypothetical protein
VHISPVLVLYEYFLSESSGISELLAVAFSGKSVHLYESESPHQFQLKIHS